MPNLILVCNFVEFVHQVLTFFDGLTSARLNEDVKVPVIIDLLTIKVIEVTKCFVCFRTWVDRGSRLYALTGKFLIIFATIWSFILA